MAWKGLILATASESPIVVVLSGSMEARRCRDAPFGGPDALAPPRPCLALSQCIKKVNMFLMGPPYFAAAHCRDRPPLRPGDASRHSVASPAAPLAQVRVLAASQPAFYRGDILVLTMGTAPLRAGEIPVFSLADKTVPIVHRALYVHERPLAAASGACACFDQPKAALAYTRLAGRASPVNYLRRAEERVRPAFCGLGEEQNSPV